MGYHLVDPETLDQWDDRPVDVRSLSTAAGLAYQNSDIGLRRYDVAPGAQLPVTYHYHDEQTEVFYVLQGTLHVETPGEEYRVEPDQAFFVEPGNPHRAYNPEDATESVRVLAIGAPSVDDVHPYDPETAAEESS